MNKMKFTKYQLEPKKVKKYFIDQLNNGNSLSQKIAKSFDLDLGRFFTILPAILETQNIYLFSKSIFPPFQKDKTWEYAQFFSSDIDSGYANFVPSASLDGVISRFILKFLSSNKNKIAIFEHVIGRPSDKFLNIDKVELTGFKNEIYYVIRKPLPSSIIEEVVQRTEQIWHFLCVLAAPKHQITLKQDESDLICEAVDYLIVTAYDGEGFIIWERNEK